MATEVTDSAAELAEAVGLKRLQQVRFVKAAASVQPRAQTTGQQTTAFEGPPDEEDIFDFNGLGMDEGE